MIHDTHSGHTAEEETRTRTPPQTKKKSTKLLDVSKSMEPIRWPADAECDYARVCRESSSNRQEANKNGKWGIERRRVDERERERQDVVRKKKGESISGEDGPTSS